MRIPAPLAAVLVAVALLGGCNDSSGDGAPTVDDLAQTADAIVLMKPTATDLNALDLRDKLVPLAGVESVVYDQSVKRLRINFTAAATAEHRGAARSVAEQDPSVERVREAGKEDAISQQPAPAGDASQAPAPTP